MNLIRLENKQTENARHSLERASLLLLDVICNCICSGDSDNDIERTVPWTAQLKSYAVFAAMDATFLQRQTCLQSIDVWSEW